MIKRKKHKIVSTELRSIITPLQLCRIEQRRFENDIRRGIIIIDPSICVKKTIRIRVETSKKKLVPPKRIDPNSWFLNPLYKEIVIERRTQNGKIHDAITITRPHIDRDGMSDKQRKRLLNKK